MKILLIDVDSKIPNLALMKISNYYRGNNEVGFNVTDPDLIFVSCIFEKNQEQALGIKNFYPDAKKHDWNAGFVFIGGEHVLEELISNLREKGIVLSITEINNIKVED